MIFYHNLSQEGIWNILKKVVLCKIYEKTAELRQFLGGKILGSTFGDIEIVNDKQPVLREGQTKLPITHPSKI
jgi:hypothetical protein